MRVFINNRNLLTWPRAMADLLYHQGHEVIWVDNDSSYPPLLRYYEETRYEVRRLGYNGGAAGAWQALGEQREPFVVTDPDLDLSRVPADWPEVLASGLALNGVKCGLSIEDGDLPADSLFYGFDQAVMEVQARVWSKPMTGQGEGFYDFPIGHTFALYNPAPAFAIGGIRTGRPYTARHLPWYVSEADNEFAYYLRTAAIGGNGSSLAELPAARAMLRAYDSRATAHAS